MTTESEPTPQTNATEAVCLTLDPETRWLLMRDLAARLERERDSAKTLNRSLLDQLEAKDAQIEALREEREQWRMSSVCCEKDAQLEAMREAIKEAAHTMGSVKTTPSSQTTFILNRPSKQFISPSLSENRTNTNTMNTPIIKEAIAWFESLPPDPKLSPEATSLALAIALHIVRQQTLRTKAWIKHDGGERPVPGSTFIRVKFSDGGEDTGPADDWGVSWTNAITHYKILDTE